MAKKKFYIWLENDVAEAFRKTAISEGKTLSETGESLIRKSMEGIGNPEVFSPVLAPSFDLSAIKRAVESAMGTGNDDIKKTILSLKDGIEKNPATGSSSESVLTKEAIETLLNYNARIYSLMLFLSMKADGGGHPDRVKISSREGDRLAQKLGYFTEKEG